MGNFRGSLVSRNPEALASDHARPHQQQVAGILGIVWRLERVVEAKRPVGLLEVDDGGMSDVKIGERTGEKLLDRLDAVGVIGYGSAVARARAKRGRPAASLSLRPSAFPSASRVSFPVRSMLFMAARLLRQFNQFAAVGRHQQAVVGLQIAADLAKGNQFIRRVEE